MKNLIIQCEKFEDYLNQNLFSLEHQGIGNLLFSLGLATITITISWLFILVAWAIFKG